MFFGDAPGGHATITQNRFAQTICYGCPVQVECLMSCVEGDVVGVYGGLTASQRKRYLFPALRRQGRSRETFIQVIAKCDSLRHASIKVWHIEQGLFEHSA